MHIDQYRHIVVEGPIAAGKSALATKLAEHCHARTLLEQPQENPFLERFYRDAERHALPAQMFFLFQRMNLVKELRQWREQMDRQSDNAAPAAKAAGNGAPASGPTQIVSDFLLEKDVIFSRLTLDEEQLALYQQLYEHLQPHAPVPDLVIYLQAPPEVLAERLRSRNLASEALISETYLSRLCESYSRFFYHYETAPLLIVNTEHLSPVDSSEDFALLLERIASMRGKREFFNQGE